LFKRLCLAGTAAIALSWFVAQHSLVGARWLFLIPIAIWIPLWILAAHAATRMSRRTALIAIVVLGGALRVAAATGTTPSISNDLYRYGWDARVQLAGTDPYRHPPAAPQLARLRTPDYFPTAVGCAHIRDRPGCSTINRPAVRTIYPPVSEAWFDVVQLADPGHGVRKWQIAAGLVDMICIGLLIVSLSRSGRDPTQAAWYALSPLPVIEFAGNGHVDGPGLLLLLAAFLALRGARPVLAGVLIGMATMVKLYPGAALIGGWRQGRWRMVAGAAGVCVLTYLPHVLAVGARIVGYLPGYLREEHYGSGGRFLLVGVLPLAGPITAGLSLALVLVGAALVVRAHVEPVRATAILLTIALLVATPVQPWYAVVVAALGVLVGTPWLAVVGLLAEPYYAAVILDAPHQVAIGRICYGLATLILVITWRRRARRPEPGCSSTALDATSTAPARAR
jgi:hypothetical protein